MSQKKDKKGNKLTIVVAIAAVGTLLLTFLMFVFSPARIMFVEYMHFAIERIQIILTNTWIILTSDTAFSSIMYIGFIIILPFFTCASIKNLMNRFKTRSFANTLILLFVYVTAVIAIFFAIYFVFIIDRIFIGIVIAAVPITPILIYHDKSK